MSNAIQAYINIYDVPYRTARVSGSRMLTNDNIQNEIKRLHQAKLQELSVGVFDLMEDIVVEARADIGDYVKFGAYDETLYEYKDGKPDKNKPVLDDEGNPIKLHKSWAQFKNQEFVDSKAIKSIRMGKDGPVIELHDRNRARDKLLEMMGDYVKNDEAEDGLINAIKQSQVFGENDGIET
ncbi:terminase small subunit [Leuconostoc miyukkimchii]|uniref:terminase small subunit n=1 Tax=Leuconostoc miyukkimchii TaxID=910540 RepID=UPI002484950A|nr:terminase small subunit [Leuconostoc miyukkimchii]